MLWVVDAAAEGADDGAKMLQQAVQQNPIQRYAAKCPGRAPLSPPPTWLIRNKIDLISGVSEEMNQNDMNYR